MLAQYGWTSKHFAKNRNNTDLVNLAAYDWAQFTPHPKHFVNTLKLV